MQQHSSFGDELRRRRRESGLTQDQLSERSGVSIRAITDIERGVVSRPHTQTIRLLADSLDISREEARNWLEMRPPASSYAAAVDSGSQLPEPPNRLIGRTETVERLSTLLLEPDAKVINVTGPGGVGKTRVAIEAARKTASEFTDGARFIDLTPLQRPDTVLPTIAASLEIRGSNPETLRDWIAAHLQRRSLLLILDNFEHLLPAAPDISRLIAVGSRSTILVTSRARLQLQVEREFPLSTFALPESADLTNTDWHPILELFEERARQSNPAFEINRDNLTAVIDICRGLDGLPLAVELAAARARVMSPIEMLPLLRERLSLLSGGYRDAPHRHRTMRDAISWSYELLVPEDQRLFRRLSVFVGGWTLDTARNVSASDTDTIAKLSSLLDNSLVERYPGELPETRFRMLETIRQFGLEELRRSSEYDITRKAHADAMLARATGLVPDLLGADPTSAMDAIELELPNVRLALEWAHANHPELGLELCGAVSWYWLRVRGDLNEARSLLTQSLSHGAVRTAARMHTLAGLAWTAHMHHDSAAASKAAREALDIARETGDDWYTAWLLHVLGRIAYFDQDPEVASAFANESLEIARKLGDEWLIGWCFQLLGIARFIAGDPVAARSHLETSYNTWAGIDDQFGMAALSALLGVVTRMEGRYEPALELFQASLWRYRRLGALWFSSNFIAEIVTITTRIGDPEEAAVLSGFVEEGWSQTGAGPAPFTRPSYQVALDDLHRLLDAPILHLAREQGRAMTLDEAVERALRIGT